MSLTKWGLVTGGAGLVGANLVKALVGRGYSVCGLGLSATSPVARAIALLIYPDPPGLSGRHPYLRRSRE